MQMTVNREQLIEALTEKRDETTTKTQKTVDRCQKAVDDLATTDSPQGWLREVADLVEAGTLAVSDEGRAYDGWFRVRTPNRGKGRVVPADEVPTFPKSNENAVQNAKASLARAKINQAESVAPYEAALKLLNMSTDETIGIDAGDYHRLLDGSASKRRRFDDAVDLEED